MIKELRSHTTLPAADLERAKKFYAEKLGLSNHLRIVQLATAPAKVAEKAR